MEKKISKTMETIRQHLKQQLLKKRKETTKTTKMRKTVEIIMRQRPKKKERMEKTLR